MTHTFITRDTDGYHAITGDVLARDTTTVIVALTSIQGGPTPTIILTTDSIVTESVVAA